MINEIGEPAMLEMLAEELAECSHEALKLARVLRNENPTPRTEKEVRTSLREEWTDVVQCAKELNLDVNWNQIEVKRQRFETRWKEAQNEVQDCPKIERI